MHIIQRELTLLDPTRPKGTFHFPLTKSITSFKSVIVILVCIGASSPLRKLAVTTTNPKLANPCAIAGWELQSPYQKIPPSMKNTAARIGLEVNGVYILIGIAKLSSLIELGMVVSSILFVGCFVDGAPTTTSGASLMMTVFLLLQFTLPILLY